MCRSSCATRVATTIFWPGPANGVCCSSRATSRWEACARASTTPCRWLGCRRWWTTCENLSKSRPETPLPLVSSAPPPPPPPGPPPPMTHPHASPDLSSLRVQIDHIDQQLLALLNQRALVAERVGEVKK